MKKALISLSIIGLTVLLVLPALHVVGVASAELGRWGIRIGTVLWFTTAPLWMRSR